MTAKIVLVKYIFWMETKIKKLTRCWSNNIHLMSLCFKSFYRDGCSVTFKLHYYYYYCLTLAGIIYYNNVVSITLR